MQSILVRAKLHRPPISPSTIKRTTLLQRLQDGLAAKATLVSAPAGFGKSTIVSAWHEELESLPSASNEQCIKVSWLSLEEADSQLPRFVGYLAAAIEERYPQSCDTLLSMLYNSPPATIEALSDVLANAMTLLPGRLVMALDDLHLINDNAIYAFLSRLIQHASSHLHMVLITQVGSSPSPLSRWRAQGLLNELRIHDLSFTVDETASFLNNNLETMPTPAIVTTLHERTEGWVVGLRLVALALRGVSDYSTLVSGFEANSNRFIIDYLMDDVMDRLSPALQQFLVCTAILTRFCPALCATVVEISEAEAQQHINYLERANLFLIELTSPAHWYRYHHQFQSMLMSRLHGRYDQQSVVQLHRQAAAWLASHDQVDGAIRHLLAIADLAAVADLIESQWTTALNEHRFLDLEEWLALLPMPLLNQRPALLVALAWVQDHLLDFTQCFVSLQRAESLLLEQPFTLPETVRHLLQANILALQISADKSIDKVAALTAIRRIWTHIRPHLIHTHCLVVVWLAHASDRLAEDDLALEILLTGLEETTEWPQTARVRLLYSTGIIYWYKCNLAQAERAFQRGLHLARQYGLHLAKTLCYFGLSLVATGRNQLELAETFHVEVVREPHYQNGLRAAVSAYSLIRIYAARGEADAARAMVERLKNHAVIIGRPYLLNQVAGLEAYLALLCGELPAAWRWALDGSKSEMYSSSDRIPVIRALIFMAEGSRASLLEANQILVELNHRHDLEHDWPFGVETLVLQALTLDKLGKMEDALSTLGKVVERAVPNGLVGPFIEQGHAIKHLLQELGKRPQYSQLVLLLLASFPSDYMRPRAATQIEELLEPLTERELEILHLLADRRSNKEIAQQLIVSANTVRNHTANIFSKLQVENRFQAVEHAQIVGLLPPLKQRSTL